ncbi:class I SAM-dependent methyltransferase [Streptomyces sp. NPDC021100]|uniref:class I SAM-dependent methyltransferase n=1 Tax=Streptomyces sp. NPDC021100 TaxID=3365114 RepID=UPI0037AE14DB
MGAYMNQAGPPIEEPRRLFAGAAQEYRRYRWGYPPALVDRVVELLQDVEGGSGPVMDLGTGPGTVAVELARRGLEVVAVDPSPEMLVAAKRAAAEAGVGERITWHTGAAERLPDVPPLRAVVIADAFHWMQRERVCGVLGDLVLPGGFMAVLSRRAPGCERPHWHAAVEAVRRKYLVGNPRAAGRGYGARLAEDHASVLRCSAFCMLTSTDVPHTVTLTLDEVVGRQFTKAFSSPDVLGEDREAFEAELRRQLSALEPSGRFIDETVAQLLVARRPAPGADS